MGSTQNCTQKNHPMDTNTANPAARRPDEVPACIPPRAVPQTAVRVQQTLARDGERARQGDTSTGPNSSWPLASRVARTCTRTRPVAALRVVKFPAFIRTEGPLVCTTASHFSTLSQINPIYALPSQSILISYFKVISLLPYSLPKPRRHLYSPCLAHPTLLD